MDYLEIPGTSYTDARTRYTYRIDEQENLWEYFFAIFDRIEFFNPGALPKPLKKLLEEDISLPRNPIIAKFFRVVKLAENAGYGFDKMINSWKEYTGSEPEFDQGQDYTKATFYFKKKEEKVRDKFGKASGKLRENRTTNHRIDPEKQFCYYSRNGGEHRCVFKNSGKAYCKIKRSWDY